MFLKNREMSWCHQFNIKITMMLMFPFCFSSIWNTDSGENK